MHDDSVLLELLARREGNEILFLNSPRLSSAAPMTLRRSVDEADLPSARFLRGITETGEGIDYRGRPVLSAVRPVAGTDWIMVAKVEPDEVYASLRRVAPAGRGRCGRAIAPQPRAVRRGALRL